MADTDVSEWRLYSTDLVTQLCILPAASGHIMQELNEPGSGELRIPLDSNAAAQISSGRFAALFYRGAYRSGFFIDNIKEIQASEEEGGGRWLSISGMGLLGFLQRPIVHGSETTDSSRSFASTPMGEILDILFNEALDLGGFTLLDWDFGTLQGTDLIDWTDDEDINLTVGQTFLDVIRQFAKSGLIEFSASLQAGAHPVLISAYAGGIGSDKSETIFFRVGTNCQEVSEDERGNEIINSYLVKYKGGYTTVSDSTSITARGRREGFLNLEVAQSGESAITFASAKLEITKNPRSSTSVRMYDGVKPYLFVDYILGDTVTRDVFGTETAERVLSVQADFNGDDYSNVIVEFNDIFYDNELKMAGDLDWLLNQWNTARDANQLEVKKWMSIGQPNGEVYSMYSDGTYLYVGGDFTQINGSVAASYVARYQYSTGTWSAMGTTITQIVRGITGFGGNIYAITTDKVYKWNGSAWTLIGTGAGSPQLKSIANDGSNLYVGGLSISSIESVSCAVDVMKYNGSVWTDVSGVGDAQEQCHALVWYNSALYGCFNISGGVEETVFQKFTTAWNEVFTDIPSSAPTAMYQACVVGNNLALLDNAGSLFLWDGTASTPTFLGALGSFGHEVTQDPTALAAYLNDFYIGAQFLSISGTGDYNNIAKYSGGSFLKLGTGFSIATPDPGRNDKINALVVNGSDVYAGGLFTTADGQVISNLAVWVTSFESLINHLEHDSLFDLASAIHQAASATITANDEIAFWEDTSGALRKDTWGGFTEAIQDAVGAMVSGNTETGITVTYQDSDGTVDFETTAVAETNANDIFRCNSPGGVSAFAGTIATLPGGAVLTYNITSGQEGAMTPASTSQLAKMRLYNTTRGTSALISDCVVGTNTITLTANVPAGWQVGDVITIASQTVSGGGFSWVDLEITSGPTSKSNIFLFAATNPGAAGDTLRTHPFEAFGEGKVQTVTGQVAGAIINGFMFVKIVSNVFSAAWTGTPTIALFRETGYLY
jgi:hypothetical protein